MKQHVSILGVLYIAYGVFGMLIAILAEFGENARAVSR